MRATLAAAIAVISFGTTERVRLEAGKSVRPYEGRVALKRSMQAELGKPPPPCGRLVYDRFVEDLQTTFKVAALDSCAVSDVQVSCQTHYLEGYRRIYLSLSYSYETESEMELLLEARQRSQGGEVAPGASELSRKDQFAVQKLFGTLLTTAYCREKDGGR